MTTLQPTPQSDASRIHATLIDIVFQSPTGSWVIGCFKSDEGEIFHATGSFGHCVLYEDFVLHGERVPDVEGADFEVRQFTSMPPRSISALPGYLAALTGAARSSTVKLVGHFGEHTIDILERTPERLYEAEIPERDIERLHNGWLDLRSNQIALAKVDIEGIPPHKLSKLQRTFGYQADLNALIKEDPYLIYVYFDDMLFTSAQSLAKRLGVANDTLSAVKGAVVATLRREAWLGHSYVEGKQMLEDCSKLLKVAKENISPLIRDAIADLITMKIITVEDRRAQLTSLYAAERKIISLAIEWSRFDNEDMDDIVPSEEMGIKLLKPMKLKIGAARQLAAGLRLLLATRFSLVQCETFADQICITTAIHHTLNAFGTDTVFATYTSEMADELSSVLGERACVLTYAALVGLDPETGVPVQRAESPISADAVVLVAADALGVEEMTHIMEAMPKTGRLFMLGSPKNMASLTVGQPFEEMVKVKNIQCFHSSFWLPEESEVRSAFSKIWTEGLVPELTRFTPDQPISWLNIPREYIPQALPELIKGLAGALKVDPLQEVRVVTPAARAPEPIGDIQNWLNEGIIKSLVPDPEVVEFQGRPFVRGIPIVIRQPLAGSNHPAFSVYTPTEITPSTMRLESRCGLTKMISLHDRIDVFPASVMTPKFIRGRIYEFVVLIVLKEHHKLITQELIATLLNTTKSTLVIAGEIEGIEVGFAKRPRTPARSILQQWVTLDVG
jgi:hypothetical protein